MMATLSYGNEPENLTVDTSLTKIVRISAGEWPPFIGKDLKDNGFVANIIREAFAEQGYSVQFYFLPWKRAYSDTLKGKYDATAIWMYDPKRTEHFFYSNPVSSEAFVFFHHIDNKFDWRSIEDISGLHLGGGLGYSYGKELNQLIERNMVKMSRVRRPGQNLRLLAAKKIDLFPEEVNVGNYTLKQQTPDIKNKITYHPEPFLTNLNYLLIPKVNDNSEYILEVFNQGLEKRKSQNE